MNNLHASSPARLGHVAIAAHHPERVAAFYRDLLDLRIVRETSNPLTGDAVLLSGDPAREDHELVFLSNRAAQHVAFRVDTREELRALYACAKNRSLPIPYALDSGVAVGFFVRDPAGNAVEIYFACGERRNDRPPLTDPVLIDELILGERGLPAVRTAVV